ncbi:MAG: discoidin domain-containing protein, partial [Actinobacteria bacterium]|nr:discoidin domain-containing protein [Actinomycetota bacterium]
PAYPGGASPYPGPGPAAPTRADPIRRPPPEHSTAARAVLSAVIVLVLAAAGVAAWSVSRSLHREAAAPPRPPSSSPSAAAAVLLKPVSATSYDTVGSDDPTEAPNAIDGSTSTAWHTSYYLGSPVFGGLKKGAGLLIDMGRPVRLSQVVVQFGALCCTHVQLEIGNTSTQSAAALSTFTVLQSSTTAHGNTTFDVTKNTMGRYVLFWLTSLPPLAGSQGMYEALIYNVTVHGYAVSQSG